MKSANWISQIGRIPYKAAPIPTPTIDSSANGESITRPAPYFSNNPWVALNTPPRGPTSSPTINTRSSRANSSSIARRRLDRRLRRPPDRVHFRRTGSPHRPPALPAHPSPPPPQAPSAFGPRAARQSDPADHALATPRLPPENGSFCHRRRMSEASVDTPSPRPVLALHPPGPGRQPHSPPHGP